MSGIKDIAKKTGLSLATISRVLNNSTLVSEKTKSIVLNAAQALDYQPNLTAAALRSGKSKIIGIIVPEINNPFFSSIINGIEQYVGKNGYSIIIAQSHESKKKERHAIQSFVKLNVDGILVSISKESNDFSFLDKLKQEKIPIVFFDRKPQIDNIKEVVFDDYYGAFMATEHLIQQGGNHLIHIAGDLNLSLYKDRKRGFQAAMERYQKSYAENHVLELKKNSAQDTQILKDHIQKNNVDSIFVNGDEDCIYVLNIIKSLGYKIPRDIRLVGFGNLSISTLVQPPISTIDQRAEDMGMVAAKTILQSLDEKQPTSFKEVLSPKLLIRESSKVISS